MRIRQLLEILENLGISEDSRASLQSKDPFYHDPFFRYLTPQEHYIHEQILGELILSKSFFYLRLGIFFTYVWSLWLTVEKSAWSFRKLDLVFSTYGSPTESKKRTVSKKTSTVSKRDASINFRLIA